MTGDSFLPASTSLTAFLWLIAGFELSRDVRTIDYICADGRFLMSPCGVAVSNRRYLSCSETRVNAGIRGWKSHLSESI